MEDNYHRLTINEYRCARCQAEFALLLTDLDLFSFFSAFQQAINYSITRPEGQILLEYIEPHPPEERPKIVKSVIFTRGENFICDLPETAPPANGCSIQTLSLG